MKGLSGRHFVEQVRILVDTTDLPGQTQCFTRVAELQKKGYTLVDSAIDNTEQSYILENEKAGA